MLINTDLFSEFYLNYELSLAADEIAGFPPAWPGARVAVLEYEVFTAGPLPARAWGVEMPGQYVMVKKMMIFDPETRLTLYYEFDAATGPALAWLNLERSQAAQRRRADGLVSALVERGRGGNPTLQLKRTDYDAAAMLIGRGADYDDIAGRFDDRAAFDRAMRRREIRRKTKPAQM